VLQTFNHYVVAARARQSELRDYDQERTMKLEQFQMERMQSTWENIVRYNLSESGVHPATIEYLIPDPNEREKLFSVELGYSQSNGTTDLRRAIAAIYPGATEANVIVTTKVPIRIFRRPLIGFFSLALVHELIRLQTSPSAPTPEPSTRPLETVRAAECPLNGITNYFSPSANHWL